MIIALLIMVELLCVPGIVDENGNDTGQYRKYNGRETVGNIWTIVVAQFEKSFLEDEAEFKVHSPHS